MTDAAEAAAPAVDAAPQEQSEESELSEVVTEMSAAPPAVAEQLIDPPAAVEVEAFPERGHADAVLRLLPSSPDRQVAFEVSRRTLQQVSRLCAQVDWVRVECNRRRERLR